MATYLLEDLGTKGVSNIDKRDPTWPSGYNAWLPSVSWQVRVSAGSLSGLAWALYKCAVLLGALYMVILQLKDPLELFVKRREFLPGSGFLSRRDLSC